MISSHLLPNICHWQLKHERNIFTSRLSRASMHGLYTIYNFCQLKVPRKMTQLSYPWWEKAWCSKAYKFLSLQHPLKWTSNDIAAHPNTHFPNLYNLEIHHDTRQGEIKVAEKIKVASQLILKQKMLLNYLGGFKANTGVF